MICRGIILACFFLVPLARAGSVFRIGTPSSLLAQLAAENPAVSRAFALPMGSVEQVQVDVEDYHLVAGKLSMAGRARGSRNSDFILKGDATDIYGWVVLKERNIAYEYTTDLSGALVVEEVPVTKIFPVCELPDGDEPDAFPPSLESQRPGPEPHIGPYPSGTPPDKFQSKPGAPKVLYWDISNARDIWTPEQFWEAWQTFSATMSMFDVNVTTDTQVYAATPVLNRGRSLQRPTTGTSSCGLNSFGTSRACTIYKKTSAAYQGGTLGHETGHQIGLSHDGSASGAYFSGFRTQQWVPMMGSHATGIRYAQGVLQYSKGEYIGANQKQDDFNIITVTRKHLAFRAKTQTRKVPLVLAGTKVSALQNRGQIVRSTDVDSFSFTVGSGGGRALLKVERTERPYGSMLDIDASLFDAAGKSLAQSNKPAHRGAEFDLPLPAGNYTLAVKGGAEGTSGSGFTNYSSLGFYAIEGEITGAAVVGIAAIGDRAPSIPIRIHPISSDARLNIDFPIGARQGQIILASMNGRIVFNSPKPVAAIDLSGLQAGNYVLSIAVDGGKVSRSVVKR